MCELPHIGLAGRTHTHAHTNGKLLCKLFCRHVRWALVEVFIVYPHFHPSMSSSSTAATSNQQPATSRRQSPRSYLRDTIFLPLPTGCFLIDDSKIYNTNIACLIWHKVGWLAGWQRRSNGGSFDSLSFSGCMMGIGEERSAAFNIFSLMSRDIVACSPSE